MLHFCWVLGFSVVCHHCSPPFPATINSSRLTLSVSAPKPSHFFLIPPSLFSSVVTLFSSVLTQQLSKQLLEVGANMNLYNKVGITSFTSACMHGEALIGTYMLQLGADVNGGGQQPLYMAVRGSFGKNMYRCVVGGCQCVCLGVVLFGCCFVLTGVGQCFTLCVCVCVLVDTSAICGHCVVSFCTN